MNKAVAILVVAFVATVSASFLQTRTLVEEAEKQLNELKSIVQGDILVAHDDLDNLITEFKTNELNVANDAGITMEQQAQAVSTQLNAIKDLANAAGYDVSSCTNVREQTLNRLPERYTEKINACIIEIDGEAIRAASDARYLVDIVMNKVHDIEHQLRQCRESILCITPLLTEIELNKIRLPQNIKTEVQATQSLLTNMRLSVQSCADSNVADYVSESYSILSDIQACVDRVIG